MDRSQPLAPPTMPAAGFEEFGLRQRPAVRNPETVTVLLLEADRASAFGTDATIQMPLDAGARLDAKDMNGDSALGWASWYARPRSIIRKLYYGPFHA